MSGWAYYNEIEPYCAAWLRSLMTAGHIPAGEVDERSIVDVRPADLRGFGQCHWFAGLAGWACALRLAGWPDDRECWTGSCPCQPFSAAGRRGGFSDERHLWPAWFRLIAECRPVAIFGEQVGGRGGMAWFDAVCDDLEGCGYAVGAVDFPACGAGAPHIRNRLWWVADAAEPGRDARRAGGADGRAAPEPGRLRDAGGLADADQSHAGTEGLQRRGQFGQFAAHGGAGPGGFWHAADWLWCRDGKLRPVEPGTRPLASGIPNRVGKLRAYGNSINAEAAKEFIAAYMECRP